MRQARMVFPPRVVYVCGPISAKTRGDRDRNVEYGRHVGVMLWAMGAVPLVPHTNSLGASDEGVAVERIYLGDLELLRRCDAVIRLPGWEASNGCRYEAAWAERHGIPMFDSLRDLEAWLDQFRRPG